MKYLRGKRATYFGNMKTLQRTHGYKVFHISSLVLIIKMLLIILLYLVATNSIMLKDYKPITNTDYILLLDDSSSMAKSDYQPNRLSSAKEIASKWISILPNSTRVGLVAFSTDIDVSTGLINDETILKDAVNNINIDYTRSGTNLDYAIEYSLDLFGDNERNKTILLMTDGTETVSNETLQSARESNIRIIAFGIGNENDLTTYEDVPDEYLNSFNTLDFNFTLLENLAEQTNGIAYKVTNEVELQESFNQATLEEVQISLDSGYYVTILIAIMSIFELLIYAKLGAL